MKKFLLTLATILFAGAAYAAPEMHVMRGNIEGILQTPGDQVIPFNPETGCYEGDFVITGYSQLKTFQYIKFYLSDGDETTYLGPAQNTYIASNKTAQTLQLKEGASAPMVSNLLVYNINGSASNNSGIEHVSIDPETMEATFTLLDTSTAYGSLGLGVSFTYPEPEIKVRNAYLFPSTDNMNLFEGYYDVPVGGAYVFLGSYPSSTAATIYVPESDIDIILSVKDRLYSAEWASRTGNANHPWARLVTPGYTKISYDLTTGQVTFTYVNDEYGTAPEPVEGALYIAFGAVPGSEVMPNAWDAYMLPDETTGKYEGTFTMKDNVPFAFYTGSSDEPVYYGPQVSTALDFDTATSASASVTEGATGEFYVSAWQYGAPTGSEIPVTVSVDLATGDAAFSIEPYQPAALYLWQIKDGRPTKYATLLPVAGKPGFYGCFLVTYEDFFSFFINTSESASDYLLGAYSADFSTTLTKGETADVTLSRGVSLEEAITIVYEGDYNLVFDMETKAFSIECENTYSGVETIGAESGDARIYNLQGVEVSRDRLIPGIYIVNGKKVCLK